MTTQQLTIPTLSWNLPPGMDYMPGAPITLQVVVYNPDTTPRYYRLDLQVIKSGAVIQEETLTVDDEADFMVGESTSLAVSGEIMVGETDALLELLLWDCADEEYVAGVTTELRHEMTWSEMLGWLGLMLFIGLTALGTSDLIKGLIQKKEVKPL